MLTTIGTADVFMIINYDGVVFARVADNSTTSIARAIHVKDSEKRKRGDA